MTTYVILRDVRVNEDDNAWCAITEAEASSPRRALAAQSLPEGDYIAVPKRSWKPLAVKVEQTTKITIG